MKKCNITITLIWLLILLVGTVQAVELDTNLTISAFCLDDDGVGCDDVGYWTVIGANGSVYENQTAGDQVHEYRSNITVWFNQTGAWHVLASFSDESINEYVVVVEDYKTGTITSIWGELQMLAVVLFTVSCMGLFAWLVFKLQEKHIGMKLFFIILTFLYLSAGSFVVYMGNTTSSINGVTVWIMRTGGVYILSVVLLYLFGALLYSWLLKAGKIGDKKGAK